MGGQAHREHASRWQFAPDDKPFEFTHLCQLVLALEDSFPYIVPIFSIITPFFVCQKKMHEQNDRKLNVVLVLLLLSPVGVVRYVVR